MTRFLGRLAGDLAHWVLLPLATAVLAAGLFVGVLRALGWALDAFGIAAR